MIRKTRERWLAKTGQSERAFERTAKGPNPGISSGDPVGKKSFSPPDALRGKHRMILAWLSEQVPCDATRSKTKMTVKRTKAKGEREAAGTCLGSAAFS